MNSSVDSENLAKGLIVGWQPLFCRGVRAILKEQTQWGVCGEATSGRRARQLCAELRPDFVLFDVDLPQDNGWDCLKDCVRLLPRAKFLVFSDKEGQQWLQRAFYAGAHGYLSKQDACRELFAALEGILSRGERFLGQRLNGALMEEWATTKKPGADSKRDAFSKREQDILLLAGEGLGVTGIAKRLGVSAKTVETHYARLKQKLGLPTTKDLREFAAKWALSAKIFLTIFLSRGWLMLGELASGEWAG